MHAPVMRNNLVDLAGCWKTPVGRVAGATGPDARPRDAVDGLPKPIARGPCEFLSRLLGTKI